MIATGKPEKDALKILPKDPCPMSDESVIILLGTACNEKASSKLSKKGRSDVANVL